MNTSRARTIEIFSEAAATYNTVGPPFFSDFARKLVEFADIAGDEDILDVATGTGVVLLEAVGYVRSATRLVGVDLTEAMLARAAAELERRGLLGIDLQVMDAESLSFADCSFDLVFCAFAFSSFPDKPQAIREFVRVLRPGGRVCILGTSRGSTMPLTHSDEELPPDDPIYGHTYFVFRNSPTPSTDTSSGT